MEERLRRTGLRVTPQRLELLRVLEKHGKQHPSFSEVYEAVQTKHQSVSQSTVLKNMITFEEIGIVRSFSFKGETHYELNPNPHVNFIDTRGKIVDIESMEIKKTLDALINIIKGETGIDAKKLLVIIE
jgi:Fur family peroxide stress response transcriptional regulator